MSMKYGKGDLIAIKTLDEKRITAIIVATFSNNQFLYCYCIDFDEYRLIYNKEVEFLIQPEFAPDLLKDPDIFDLDYSFYEACAEHFSYTPYGVFPYYFALKDDEDSSED